MQRCSTSLIIQFSSVQSLSCVWLFATPWFAAHQTSLSITNSLSLLKLMSIESVMPSSHLMLCHPLLLLPPIPPSIRVFSMSQLFAWGGQSTGVSALASVLPMNTQDWSPFRMDWLDLLLDKCKSKLQWGITSHWLECGCCSVAKLCLILCNPMDCSLPTRLEYNLRIIKSPGLIQILSIMEKKFSRTTY